MDPLVEIHLRRNGSSSQVTYGQVTPAMVPEIVEKHILGGQPIKEWLVLTDEGTTEYNSFYEGQRS
jgi:(2Fe-2S) ferredoxin